MAKSIRTQLREIAQAERLTDRQRAFVVEQSAAMGVRFEPRETRCRDCYRDQAVVLWRLIEEAEARKQTSRQYLLRAGVDVVWRGRRVNATTQDKELAALLAAGFPQQFFSRIAGEDGRWL